MIRSKGEFAIPTKEISLNDGVIDCMSLLLDRTPSGHAVIKSFAYESDREMDTVLYLEQIRSHSILRCIRMEINR